MCPTYLNTVQGDVGRLGVRKRESLCGYEGQLAAEPGLSGEGVPHQCPCHYHHRIASWRGERGGGTPYESTFLSGQKFMFPKSDNTNSYLTQEKMLCRESWCKGAQLKNFDVGYGNLHHCFAYYICTWKRKLTK